ncbi:hypothetical protein FRX31_012926 [Thalictrum thalictroides]|uniref:Uncharacterized protein n=1 Tax=Thalictrum thalictroides TaxID=46969 RepID=A0A7J6WKL3_THATH|nr:hypothetical protein FRX31_012926 [Thalictrum thalictroides]
MYERTCKTADDTSTQAMWFRSQSVCNQSDNIFGVSYDYLEKAIEKIAENTILDHKDSTVPPTMEENKCIRISVDHRSFDMVDTMSSIKNGDFTYIKPLLHAKDLLLNMNRKGNQIPSPKDGSIKETKIKPWQNLSQTHSSSSLWRSNVSNQTASQKGKQSCNSIVQRMSY